MRTTNSAFAILGAVTLMCASLVACSDDDPSTSGSGAASSSTGPGGGGEPAGTGGSPAGTGGSGGGADGYTFDSTPFDDYVQTDRHGAVEAGTVGIAAASGLGLGGEDISIRDEYNASNPAEDAEGTWVAEITNSLTVLHGALDDDLTGAGLTPATLQESLAQAAPVVVPDTIKFDPSQPAAYPNGRKLTDPVVDITVAAALVDLGAHPLDVLADLPLNPPENDVPFKGEFPYLADPH